MDHELAARLALQLLPGVGPVAWRKILAATGTASHFMEQGFPDPIARQLTAAQRERFGNSQRRQALQLAHKELEHVHREGLTVCGSHQSEFPQRLLQCPDAPLVLFAKGTPAWSARKVLAVVGTRRCTRRGMEWVQQLVAQLPPGVIVVSGLAKGIDAAAHQAALKYGVTTWGVSAGGLQDVYPAQHRELAQRMVEQGGALVSEVPFRQGPEPGAFPRRNRIVAGLVDAVIVVESWEKGGSLITARLASSYHREVFAVPGRPEDGASMGCLNLLVQHGAAPVLNASQLCQEMGWGAQSTEASNQREPVPEHLEALYRWMAERAPVHMDEIKRTCPVAGAAAKLLELECLSRVKARPGGCYECT